MLSAIFVTSGQARAMTQGYPDDATEDAVQADIAAAKYSVK